MSEAKVEFEKRFGGMTPDHPCVPDVWMSGFEAGKSSRDGLREALEDITKWRKSALSHDEDMGYEPREFCEDVELIEDFAKNALEDDGDGR